MISAQKQAVVDGMVLRRSGRWTPDEELINGVDYHRLAFEYMRDRIPQFRNVVAQVMPQSSVAFEFLAHQTHVNACAVRSGEDDKVYLIGVYGGLVIETMRLFREETFLTSVRDDLKELSDIEDDALSLFCAKVVLDCVFLHELAHVLRGHLPFLGETDALDIDFELSHDDEVAADRVRDRFRCEADADRTAGRLLSLFIKDRIIDLPHGLRDATTAHELLTLAYTSIFLLFAMMESRKSELTASYPEPLLRFTEVAKFVDRGLKGDTELDMFRGMILGFAISQALNFRWLDYEILGRFEKFQTADSAEIDELEHLLAAYRPS